MPKGLNAMPEVTDEIEMSPLRPEGFSDFIGQRRAVEALDIAVRAAQSRGEPIDHVLLHGPPGLGKTSLALLVGREMGTRTHLTSAPILEKPADLVSVLAQLQDGDVLFIDEIHRLKPAIEEFLYPAMEDSRVDIRFETGDGAKLVTVPLPPFTLVGATTRAGLLTAPMRARFGLVLRLEDYSAPELARIVLRSARIQNITCDSGGAAEIAGRARGNPRLANRLLRRIRDHVQVAGDGQVTRKAARRALDAMEIDARGLDEMDRRLLSALLHNFSGGPVGLKTLAIALSEDPQTIEESYEPFLIQSGMLERTARGRMLTDAGRKVVAPLD
jgi:holliday junction DNA helicase RuvB